LYQIQRAALQQRAREKDHQLACLSEEREALRKKLADLSDLVCRLVEERKSLNKETTQLSESQEPTSETSGNVSTISRSAVKLNLAVYVSGFILVNFAD